MARMYSRRKGQSGSTRPYRKENPPWIDMESDEVEEIIVNLWKQDKSTSEIGMILRDRHGIPDVTLITHKKIVQTLKDHNMELNVPEDMRNLIIKALRLRTHLAENKRDVHNKRALQLTESKIRRLVKYYRRTGVLPRDWVYRPDTAEMLITR
ncbi:MAG: 30S ribosomal protein S15 [Euryarchaeota archaeon]|nr:30S ribosomal protein S15 [Euryarchaeota archaeon]